LRLEKSGFVSHNLEKEKKGIHSQTKRISLLWNKYQNSLLLDFMTEGKKQSAIPISDQANEKSLSPWRTEKILEEK